ncbi:small ribosomal subunit Rsm22 family protein [Methylocystis sp. JR02]|uniref:small ribosomal subunit Rsm22 family protein n=1 Tax=Methylocystis sp. JR02 TaxID=3046284 RepID=UPI0024BB1137|nr:small ribosomal subunit Rsm22 family protein [Methylocystis sp. JR02]MDJ0447676.1 small ribosomal subunit Rsm22 family protein [Methylocystis sp. JR02]
MTSPALPAGLAAALAAQLERRPRKALAESAERLSASYRAHKPTNAAIRDETDALAYALTRMPATYAAAVTALDRLAEEQPGFSPKSLLDVGCGLGAASYAASAVWPALDRIEMVDSSRAFLAMVESLAAEAGLLTAAKAVAGDMTRLPNLEDKFDLVTVGYALTELGDADLPGVTDRLWARTGGALFILEPGTPRDHQRLMGVRARLIAQGATILAPCAHTRPCPLAAPDWCHFAVRLPRSREHKLLKGAAAPFEDEKYSYLIAARQGESAKARILAPPRHNKAGVTVKLCDANGSTEIFLPKRDKARYESIRRKEWGDALDVPPEEA